VSRFNNLVYRMPTPTKILTLNSGSSSLKFAIYQVAPDERLLLAGKLERIGLSGGHVEITGESVKPLKEDADLPDHATAIGVMFGHLTRLHLAGGLSAIGHRVVMGGPRHTAPQQVTPELLAELNELTQIDLPHLPAALKTIEAAQKFSPGILQVACFDTSFHRTMPLVAQTYALPRALAERLGIIRYGFHGLSYEYILSELRRKDPAAAEGKVIVAHLGNGASMAAIHQGRSVETTMGFTPAGGLVMSSRSGDLDPGVLVQLLTQKKMSPSELNDLIYKESGLLGVSNLSSDMQDLTREKDRNPQAEEAINLFCYQAKKYLGALVSVLDGVETLIFTGGIGENSDLVRERICENLSYLGLHLDEDKNKARADVISTVESRVTVRVMKTNEELMIARHTEKLLRP
jgi:acetate kinase